MAKKLAANVFVDGVMYRVGDAPEKEVADKIANPKAWGDEPEADGGDKAPAKKAASSRTTK